MIETVALIVIAWFAISIPVSLLAGQMFARSNKAYPLADIIEDKHLETA